MLFSRPKLINISIFETFYLNGVNVFDFWGKEHIKKTKPVKATFLENNRLKERGILTDICKVEGKSCSFEIGIGEFSMAKYAVFIMKNSDYLKIMSHENKAIIQEDACKNDTYRKEIAMGYSKQPTEQEKKDFAEIIYSDTEYRRALIIKREEGFYEIVSEKLFLLEDDELYFHVINPTPYWYWAGDSNSKSITDTFENARKLALEKLI